MKRNTSHPPRAAIAQPGFIRRLRPFVTLILFTSAVCLAAAQTGYGPAIAAPKDTSPVVGLDFLKPNLIDQSESDARSKSVGCVACHKGIDSHTMHLSPNVVLGCTDCHGGNAAVNNNMRIAHVQPRHPELWPSSANANTSNVALNHESEAFIRFVNPSDLRVAAKTCGPCHQNEVKNVSHSMMRHGSLLWGAALYNNGSSPSKNPRFGQAYGSDGVALTLTNQTKVTLEMTRDYGIIPYLDPLPRFALGHPGNILRIFERGGEKPLQLGVPNTSEPPGKPFRRLSERGLGTLNRVDPVILNLQKTRLHDPTLDFMGSNNRPGDYRASGCASCHVIYANDRSPANSSWYSKYGHQGLSFSGDKMIRKDERGHPIKHVFTRAIPSSQCMNCHMHQGNMFVNTYLGYTWWDQESDAKFLYPNPENPLANDPHFLNGREKKAFTEPKHPTDEEMVDAVVSNPEAAAARGLWGDLDFLEKAAELNPKLKQTQLADYHGHGWLFRAVFKKDRQGNLRGIEDQLIKHDETNKFAKAVHLKDIHLAKGMQCVDCHFDTDVHGDGNLYGEARAATSIECIDCHGTISKRPTLMTSGNGGKYNTQDKGVDLSVTVTSWGPRFVWKGKRLFQRSSLSPDVRWEIPQTKDVIDPKHPRYNEKARYAKTLRRDGDNWGDTPDVDNCARELAHDNSNISCQICHSSWATSCFGCHLPMKANQKTPLNKFEGMTTRNFTSYNPQVVRDDVFQLGIDATYKSNRLAVIRSSSAVVVGSQNQNREWVYSQQQTVSAEGYSGQAYNPHFPHTTSGRGTTKNCSDCHISAQNDNNAWMASLLGLGTGTVNFFGRYAYVGAGKGGLYGVVWTEREEPQAAIGSHLHKYAYPDRYKTHLKKKTKLEEAHHHPAEEILDLTLRGEYLYTANGKGGLRIFDVANIDNKAFSERIVTAPFSPAGQRMYVKTEFATSVTLPGTQAVDPLRLRSTNNFEHPEHGLIYNNNEEQKVSLIYAWVFVTDLEEGLVMATVGTLLDGNPRNNFMKEEKVIRYNPKGQLDGAMHSHMAGTNLLVVAKRGLFVLGLSNDELIEPTLNGELTGGEFKNPRAVGVQFRYAFVTDEEGFKTVDITDPSNPKFLPDATVPLKNAQRFYLARNIAYVANGAEGLAIIDITNPEKPKKPEMFNAGGLLNDTRAVQVGSVNASMYGLVADGKNGLRVLQLISPENVPEYMGFIPVPKPKLIATYPTKKPAVAVSRGLDRDRVVDESGNQTVVFGRRGSRPFNLKEMARFIRHEGEEGRDGKIYKVEDLIAEGFKAKAKSGEAFKPPIEPKTVIESTQSRPQSHRIMRRGRFDRDKSATGGKTQ
jgi:hypothetical protein